MVFIGISYAGNNVTIKVVDPAVIYNSKRDTAAMFIEEIKQFLETPMYWCTLEPTGESKVFATENSEVYILQVTGEMSCHEKPAYDYFKSIANRYRKFLLAYGGGIDEMIQAKYPDLEFKCIMMNHTFAASIQYKKKKHEDTENYYNNKIKFFKMVLNDEFISPTLEIFRYNGSLISTHTNPGYSLKIRKEFTFKVYKKTISKGSLKVRFETVYHPTPEDYATLLPDEVVYQSWDE